jgi:hypothetical protein
MKHLGLRDKGARHNINIYRYTIFHPRDTSRRSIDPLLAPLATGDLETRYLFVRKTHQPCVDGSFVGFDDTVSEFKSAAHSRGSSVRARDQVRSTGLWVGVRAGN